MLLSRLTVNHERFQFRTKKFSQRSVDAMVARFDPAMFDPIPVVEEGMKHIVAGDGHSRYEALCFLARDGRLPPEWRDGDDWEIPTRLVSYRDALKLAYIANMGAEPFTAIEEAKIFQARANAGESIDEIAESSHRDRSYVKKRLALNCLCMTIREAVGQPWGLDVDKSIALAEACERYGIPHPVQQDLWLKIISHGDWTQNSMRLFMRRFGENFAVAAAGAPTESFLFALPPNAEAVVKQITAIADERRMAQRGLQWLLRARNALSDFPELVALLNRDGEAMVDRVKVAQKEDAEALNALVAA